MAKGRDILTEQQLKDQYLGKMSDEQLQCRAGHRHSFPSDHLSAKMKQVPDGLRVRVRKGIYTIDEDCERDCGRCRVYSSNGPGVLFDKNVTYRYYTREDKRRDWVTVPESEGIRITGRDAKAEMFGRVEPLLKAVALELQ